MIGEKCSQVLWGMSTPGLALACQMVGLTGFEPATTSTPRKCATRLRYSPTYSEQWGTDHIAFTGLA